MDFQKAKNILDLNYNTYLTFLNTFVIIIITGYFTFVIGTMGRIEWTFNKLSSSGIIMILLIIIIWIIFYTKLKKIKLQIQNLS